MRSVTAAPQVELGTLKADKPTSDNPFSPDRIFLSDAWPPEPHSVEASCAHGPIGGVYPEHVSA